MRFFAFFFLFISLSNAHAQDADPEIVALLKEATADKTSFEDPYLAQVWLVDMSTRLQRYAKDPEFRVEFLRSVHREATRADLPPELVLAVIQIESLFDTYALSRAGARGLMQVMPFWKDELGRDSDNLFDMNTNLRYGCTILAHYIKKEKGDLIRALARYNGSLGKTWYPEKVLLAWEKHWFVNKL